MDAAVRTAGVYNCHADTSIEGIADVLLSNGKTNDTGYTKSQCEAECASKATCASFVYGSHGGSTTYCELWSKTTGTSVNSGTAFCTKPLTGANAPIRAAVGVVGAGAAAANDPLLAGLA